MYISCFNLFFVTSSRQFMKTTYSLYENSLTLFYSNMVIDLLHNYSVNFIVAPLGSIVFYLKFHDK